MWLVLTNYKKVISGKYVLKNKKFKISEIIKNLTKIQ